MELIPAANKRRSFNGTQIATAASDIGNSMIRSGMLDAINAAEADDIWSLLQGEPTEADMGAMFR